MFNWVPCFLWGQASVCYWLTQFVADGYLSRITLDFIYLFIFFALHFWVVLSLSYCLHEHFYMCIDTFCRLCTSWKPFLCCSSRVDLASFIFYPSYQRDPHFTVQHIIIGTMPRLRWSAERGVGIKNAVNKRELFFFTAEGQGSYRVFLRN